MHLVIAIDGPAGSGKSTIAKMLAKHLGFNYLDTGAMYRALTWKAMYSGVNLEDENALCSLMGETSIELQYKDNSVEVFVDGINVTKEIRLPSVTNNIHFISNKLRVRQRMVKLQQKYASVGNTVAEGRDMGTVVFSEADKKFFLDANVEERARRRFAELNLANKKVSYGDVVKDIETRDNRDITRSNSPLIKSEDATYINTTGLTIGEVFNKVLNEIEPILKNRVFKQ